MFRTWLWLNERNEARIHQALTTDTWTQPSPLFTGTAAVKATAARVRGRWRARQSHDQLSTRCVMASCCHLTNYHRAGGLHDANTLFYGSGGWVSKIKVCAEFNHLILPQFLEVACIRTLTVPSSAHSNLLLLSSYLPLLTLTLLPPSR